MKPRLGLLAIAITGLSLCGVSGMTFAQTPTTQSATLKTNLIQLNANNPSTWLATLKAANLSGASVVFPTNTTGNIQNWLSALQYLKDQGIRLDSLSLNMNTSRKNMSYTQLTNLVSSLNAIKVNTLALGGTKNKPAELGGLLNTGFAPSALTTVKFGLQTDPSFTQTLNYMRGHVINVNTRPSSDKLKGLRNMVLTIGNNRQAKETSAYANNNSFSSRFILKFANTKKLSDDSISNLMASFAGASLNYGNNPPYQPLDAGFDFDGRTYNDSSFPYQFPLYLQQAARSGGRLRAGRLTNLKLSPSLWETLLNTISSSNGIGGVNFNSLDFTGDNIPPKILANFVSNESGRETLSIKLPHMTKSQLQTFSKHLQMRAPIEGLVFSNTSAEVKNALPDLVRKQNKWAMPIITTTSGNPPGSEYKAFNRVNPMNYYMNVIVPNAKRQLYSTAPTITKKPQPEIERATPPAQPRSPVSETSKPNSF